jgi:hypothetical protein
MARSPRVKFSGQFFEKDVTKTIRANLHDMLVEIAAGAERDIAVQLQRGEAGRAPLSLGRPGGRKQARARGRGQKPLLGNARVSQFVRGRVQSLSGKPWQLHAVVSPNTTGMNRKHAISLMAAASHLEGEVHAWRRTARAIKRARKDLAAGLQ